MLYTETIKGETFRKRLEQTKKIKFLKKCRCKK